MNFRNVSHIAWCLSWFYISKSSVWQLIEVLLLKNSHRCWDFYLASTINSYSLITAENSLLILTKGNFDLKLLSVGNENSDIDKAAFVKLISAFSGRNVAILRHDDPSLLLYFNYIKTNINIFGKEELISLLSSFAELNFEGNSKINHEYLNFLALIENRILEIFDNLSISNISIILWSLGVCGKTDLELAKRCMKEVFNFSLTELNNTEPKIIRSFLFGVSDMLEKQKLTIEQKQKIMLLKNLAFKKVTSVLYNKSLKERRSELYFIPLDLRVIFKMLQMPYITEFVIKDYNVDFYLPGFFDLDLDIFLKSSKKDLVQKLMKKSEADLKWEKDQDEHFMNLNLTSYSDFENYFEKTRHNSLVIEINGHSHYILKDEVLKNSSKMKIKSLEEKVSVLIIPKSIMKDISNSTLDKYDRAIMLAEYLKKEKAKYKK